MCGEEEDIGEREGGERDLIRGGEGREKGSIARRSGRKRHRAGFMETIKKKTNKQ